MTGAPILALDCSAAACSVAIASQTAAGDLCVRSHCMQPMERGHAAALAPMIEAALAEARLRPASLGLLAVTIGPGSFTGVRIGLATARGFAVALGLPLAGVTTIETLLAGATDDDRARLRNEDRVLMAAIDTRRGDFYVGFEDAPLPGIAGADDIVRHAAGRKLLVVGDGAIHLCDGLTLRGIDAVMAAAPATPDAVALARLAGRRKIGEWRAANAREGMPRPLYLRPADVTATRSAR
jgi:tRNA threonylcarbamoyladenosine biosynthesis protein TsaB